MNYSTTDILMEGGDAGGVDSPTVIKYKKEGSPLIIIEELLEEKSYSAPERKISHQDNNGHSLALSCKNGKNAGDYVDKEEIDVDVKSVQLSPACPIKLKHDKVMGRCLVAARDILPGETFLNDWPIITAPNAGESDGGGGSSASTCLGCCAIITTEPQACPRCGWPVCSDACANIPQHANFECKVFSKEDIKRPLPSPYSYIAPAEYIKILRCLLLKEEGGENGFDPERLLKWKQILSLEAHLDLRRHIPKVQFMSGMVKRFVRQLCKLTGYDDPTIEFVLGVVDVNAFRHSFEPTPLKKSVSLEEEGPIRNATFLYPQASMAAHGCIRNTDWKTLPGGQLAMRASHLIPQGGLILHAYVDLMLGTPERRRLLHNLFYFDCTCARCSDPTEMGTYFSALKCTKCASGSLLPSNPLQYKSSWVCDAAGCDESKPYQYERDLVQQVLAEEKLVTDHITPTTPNMATIKALMKILKQHRSITLHPNHYRIVSVEHVLVRHLLRVPKPPKEIMLEVKRLLKKYMKLSSVFHPVTDDDHIDKELKTA